MKTQLLLLLLIFPALSQAQEYKNSKHALALNFEGFLFAASPYLAGMTIQGLKYDYVFGNPDRKGLTYLSTGLQLIAYTGQPNLAIPIELCVGTSLNKVSFHAGAGGIVHTGGLYLQPAIFFTLHAKLRFRFGMSPIFMDLEARGFNSYGYIYQNGGYRGPVKRSGRPFSPGMGVSVGSYLK